MNLDKTTSKPIPHIFLIVVCVAIWFIGFTFNTGFGESYGILDKAKTAIMVVFLYCIVFQHKKYKFTAGNVIAVFIVIYMIIINEARNSRSIENYIWVWLLIPIFKMFSVQKAQFKLIGLAYGVACMGILFIGNVTGVFDGWDGNSASMTQFFSYTVFMASLSDTKDKKNIWLIVIYSAAYLYLLNKFNSRSAQLFSVAMLLCMLSVVPFRKYFSKPLIMLVLLFPLIVAIGIVLIKDLPIVEALNDWSYDVFNKPIFNGRDIIWKHGFSTWLKHPLIGNGDMDYDRYHNSAITGLVGAGGIGYIILISVCYKILTHSKKWINDSVVYGLATAFLIIWMQQSVEIGLLSSTPNVIPYMILGLLYARINTLESGKDDETIYNNTDLQHRNISA